MNTETTNEQRVEVYLDIVEGVLIANIEAGPHTPGRQYAFYLQHNGRKVETRWYSDDARAIFTTRLGDGRFRAIGFVRDSQADTPMMVASKPLVRTADAGKSAVRGLPVHCIGLDGINTMLERSGPTRFDVGVGAYAFQCLVTRSKGDSLYVILGGAVPERHLITLPRFNRFTWADDFPGTQLCIADPTLTLDNQIRVGWYFGSGEEDATQGLCAVVLAVAEALHVGHDKIFAYGSSGGGFAALQLVALLGQGATAIAINAQIDVLRYSVKASVDKFLSVCTGGLSRQEARRKYSDRLSALESWTTAIAASARCLLVQNRGDQHHYKKHFLPFVSHFADKRGEASADGRIATMIYDHPNGHGYEPRDLLPTILQRARQLEWRRH